MTHTDPDILSGYRPPQSAGELLSRYANGERHFRAAGLPGGSTLNGAVLTGSDFNNSWLSVVDFRSADLPKVLFDETNVKISDFRDADLHGTSFRDAALCRAMFAKAKLDNVRPEGASWYGATVTDTRVLAELFK